MWHCLTEEGFLGTIATRITKNGQKCPKNGVWRAFRRIVLLDLSKNGRKTKILMVL